LLYKKTLFFFMSLLFMCHLFFGSLHFLVLNLDPFRRCQGFFFIAFHDN
jgi:hypothetical protein